MRSKTAKYFNKVELNHSSEIVCNNLKKWVKIKLENLENPIPSTNASEKEKSIALPVGKEMAKGSSKEVKNSIVVYLRVKPLKSMD